MLPAYVLLAIRVNSEPLKCPAPSRARLARPQGALGRGAPQDLSCMCVSPGWIRKGVEARRTRSQSRIGRLEQLRAKRTGHPRQEWLRSAAL